MNCRSRVVLQAAASTSSPSTDDWIRAAAAATNSGGTSAVGSSSGGGSSSRRKREPLLGLIVQALRAAGDRGLVLASIYRYVTENSADYADVDSHGAGTTTAAWRKNVRHILSVRNFFVKTAEQNPDGRGRFWRLDEVKYAEFLAERADLTETRDRRTAAVTTSCRGSDSYMASVQTLSALADNHAMTSFPIYTGNVAPMQYMAPQNASSWHLSTAPTQHRQAPACRQQYGGLAQARWNTTAALNSYHAAGDQHTARYQLNGYQVPQYINGFQQLHVTTSGAQSTSWHPGWSRMSARYHPYAAAGAGRAASSASAGSESVGFNASSTMPCLYNDQQRAPAQSYVAHTLDGAAEHEFSRQVAYDVDLSLACTGLPLQQQEFDCDLLATSAAYLDE